MIVCAAMATMACSHVVALRSTKLKQAKSASIRHSTGQSVSTL